VFPQVALVAMLVALFTWNNYGFFVGGLTSTGSASYRGAAALVIAAAISGVLSEGWKVSPAALSAGRYEPALAASAILLGASNALNVPASISNILVIGLVGSAAAHGEAIDLDFLATVILAWIISPLAAVALTSLVYTLVQRLVQRGGLLTLLLFNRLAAYLVTLYAAYTLAANNMGFMVNMAPGDRPLVLLATLTAAAAGIAMTRRAYIAMGEGFASLSPQRYFTSVFAASLILWILTQMGIPAALTQLVIGAFLGSIMSSRLAILNVRRLKVMVFLWIVSAALSLPTSYFMALALPYA